MVVISCDLQDSLEVSMFIFSMFMLWHVFFDVFPRSLFVDSVMLCPSRPGASSVRRCPNSSAGRRRAVGYFVFREIVAVRFLL